MRTIFFLILCTTFCSSVAYSQFITNYNNSVDWYTEYQVTNSPGNSPTTRRSAYDFWDSGRQVRFHTRMQLDTVAYRPVNNISNKILVIDDTGFVSYSTNFYNKGDADTRYPLLSGSYSNPLWITALAWSKIASTPTTLAGYGITDATSNARSAITLTTTGTSGAAAYSSSTGVLNIPNYAITSGTVTSVGLISSDFSVSGSPVTTSGSITANLNTSGVTAGTYTNVTVNNKGIITSGTNIIESLQTRAFTTAYQPSATRWTMATWSFQIDCNLSLTGGQEGTIQVQTSPDNATWTTKATLRNSNTGTLTIGLNTTQKGGNPVTILVAPNYYVRAITTNVTGTPTFTFVSADEGIL